MYMYIYVYIYICIYIYIYMYNIISKPKSDTSLPLVVPPRHRHLPCRAVQLQVHLRNVLAARTET